MMRQPSAQATRTEGAADVGVPSGGDVKLAALADTETYRRIQPQDQDVGACVGGEAHHYETRHTESTARQKAKRVPQVALPPSKRLQGMRVQKKMDCQFCQPHQEALDWKTKAA